MPFEARDALLQDDPGTYYLKDHYVDYPCVLVRLARASDEALRDLLASAHRFVSSGARRGRRVGAGSRPRRPR